MDAVFITSCDNQLGLHFSLFNLVSIQIWYDPAQVRDKANVRDICNQPTSNYPKDVKS
jgi:hypothetical protein